MSSSVSAGRGTSNAATSVFEEYFRCPSGLATFVTPPEVAAEPGYFSFGDAICWGHRSGPTTSAATGELHDVLSEATAADGVVSLPFDFAEIVQNLQYERYCQPSEGDADGASEGWTRSIYYFVRPVLSVAVRKHLQRLRLRGWEHIAFPRWPVEFSLQTLMERTMGLALQSCSVERVPFIWFWPEGAPACAIMTHDVETEVGRNFCTELMDLNDVYGIKSSFQLVPEVRYEVPTGILDGMRARGFEVNVHDLNHDGRLYQSRQRFLERAERINAYARRFRSQGFRSGAMYRRQDWYDAFEFSYDMSVPNVAHLEPQRGGCCTVMPYFVGNLVELPLTAIQDYSLFHIVGDYSIAIWKKQIDMIRARHGMASFICHPDYLIEKRARGVYEDLLAHLRDLRDAGELWLPLPREVAEWWRNRSQMRLVKDEAGWRIEGPQSHAARVAYASVQDGRLCYSFDPS